MSASQPRSLPNGGDPLMVWARAILDGVKHAPAGPAKGLVTAGPYQLIRHPIYSSVCPFMGWRARTPLILLGALSSLVT